MGLGVGVKPFEKFLRITILIFHSWGRGEALFI